jgi:hypothetical protein
MLPRRYGVQDGELDIDTSGLPTLLLRKRALNWNMHGIIDIPRRIIPLHRLPQEAAAGIARNRTVPHVRSLVARAEFGFVCPSSSF